MGVATDAIWQHKSVVTDGLVMQGSRASAAMVLTLLSLNSPASAPGGCLNIKMSSYEYSDPHVKDKTVSQPSYL